MTNALYVSLGHNSSAVLARDGRVVRGYEQERLDRRKSSSAYPREAIEHALGALSGVDIAYVSHWFDTSELATNKYLDLDHLRGIASEVVTLSHDFSHHDAHAQSALSFFRSNGGRKRDADVIVLDGFGTNQECLSVYRARWPFTDKPRRLHRSYGYARSLGLMYQCATEYLGMKPHQDEYKLLGYESRILKVVSRERVRSVIAALRDQARVHVESMLESNERPPASGDLIDYERLKHAKAVWYRLVDRWRQLFEDVQDEGQVRTCVAFCAQTFLEECVVRLVDALLASPGYGKGPQIVLAGGCFLNVKLTRRIQRHTGRRVFAHPLAGDQGAALGFTPGLDCHGLTWGARSITGRNGQVPLGVEVVSPDAWHKRAAELLLDDRIVNVVRGAMEYGPRALCNTSTLALPTRENVARINALNERDDAMPMAPVLTRNAAIRLFRYFELADMAPADRFMITTVMLDRDPPERLMGVVHPDPLDANVVTARPQVVDNDSDMEILLSWMPDEVLINTSFNYHGEPIVYSEDDACRTHSMQCFRAKTLGIEPPITLLVRP